MIEKYVIASLFILVSIVGVYWKWTSMSTQLETLKQDNTTLSELFTSQQEVITTLQQDKENVSKLLEQRTEQINKINANLITLTKSIKNLDDKQAIEWKRTEIPKSILDQIK